MSTRRFAVLLVLVATTLLDSCDALTKRHYQGTWVADDDQNVWFIIQSDGRVVSSEPLRGLGRWRLTSGGGCVLEFGRAAMRSGFFSASYQGRIENGELVLAELQEPSWADDPANQTDNADINRVVNQTADMESEGRRLPGKAGEARFRKR